MSAPNLSPARSTKPINSQRHLSRPFIHLQTCQQADVTRRNVLVGNTACSVCSREFRPLACELLPRSLFIPYAIFRRLTDRQPSRGGDIELAIPRNIELRHSVGHRDNQRRTHDDHRDRDRHYGRLFVVGFIAWQRRPASSPFNSLFKLAVARLCENRQAQEVAVGFCIAGDARFDNLAIPSGKAFQCRRDGVGCQRAGREARVRP
jgi:hypothetical protein